MAFSRSGKSLSGNRSQEIALGKSLSGNRSQKVVLRKTFSGNRPQKVALKVTLKKSLKKTPNGAKAA